MVDYSTRRTMMVDTQVRPSDVTKFPIIDAMLSVPREVFVPDNLREAAYMGEHLVLGGDRVVLEPRTFAKLLEVLDVQPSHTVLDLGCGLGYSTAILAHLADFVAGVEDDADLAKEAQSLLSENGFDNAAVLSGDLAEGAAKSGPYDIIIAQGAVEVVPAVILEQLREGGRIACIFAEGSLGVVRVGHKMNGKLSWRFAFNATAPVLTSFKKEVTFSL